MWIFGYGSLIFRPSFPFEERRPAWLRGWARRFWQASTDHRGVPGAPGRVVTLVRDAEARCWGLAYRIAAEQVDAVLSHLDDREQGGYERHDIEIETADGGLQALMYLAGPQNPCYTGESSLEEIARIVQTASGPSGTNRSYVEQLAAALTAAGEHDAHVHGLARLIAPAGPAGKPALVADAR